MIENNFVRALVVTAMLLVALAAIAGICFGLFHVALQLVPLIGKGWALAATWVPAITVGFFLYIYNRIKNGTL